MHATAQQHHDTLDGRLVDQARHGDRTAFDELVQRHAFPAWRLALALGNSVSIAEQGVADGFAATFRGLSRGTLSATTAFRIHVVRHSAEAAALAARADHARPDVAPNTMVEAFRRLPERWRAVLWLTAVEGGTPAQVAPVLGLSPDATAALAQRASAGLRERYLHAACATSMPDPVPWLRALVTPMPRSLAAGAAAAWSQWLDEDAATRRRGLASVIPLGPWAERAVAGAAAAVFAVGVGTAIAMSSRPSTPARDIAAGLSNGQNAAGAPASSATDTNPWVTTSGADPTSTTTTSSTSAAPRLVIDHGRTPAAAPGGSSRTTAGTSGGSAAATDPSTGTTPPSGSTAGSGGTGGTGGGTEGTDGGGGTTPPPADQSTGTIPTTSAGASAGGTGVSAVVDGSGVGVDVGGTTIGTATPPAPPSTDGVVVTVGGITIHVP